MILGCGKSRGGGATLVCWQRAINGGDSVCNLQCACRGTIVREKGVWSGHLIVDLNFDKWCTKERVGKVEAKQFLCRKTRRQTEME